MKKNNENFQLEPIVFVTKVHTPHILRQILSKLNVYSLIQIETYYHSILLVENENFNNQITSVITTKLRKAIITEEDLVDLENESDISKIINDKILKNIYSTFQINAHKQFDNDDVFRLLAKIRQAFDRENDQNNRTTTNSRKNLYQNDFLAWILAMAIFNHRGQVFLDTFRDWVVMLVLTYVVKDDMGDQIIGLLEYLVATPKRKIQAKENSPTKPKIDIFCQTYKIMAHADALWILACEKLQKYIIYRLIEEMITCYPNTYSDNDFSKIGKFISKLTKLLATGHNSANGLLISHALALCDQNYIIESMMTKPTLSSQVWRNCKAKTEMMMAERLDLDHYEISCAGNYQLMIQSSQVFGKNMAKLFLPMILEDCNQSFISSLCLNFYTKNMDTRNKLQQESFVDRMRSSSNEERFDKYGRRKSSGKVNHLYMEGIFFLGEVAELLLLLRSQGKLENGTLFEEIRRNIDRLCAGWNPLDFEEDHWFHQAFSVNAKECVLF